MTQIRCFLLTLLIGASAMGQTDLIFPWVTNNASFRGKLIVNNLNQTEVSVTLTAQREVDAADPVKSQTKTTTIAGLSQLVVSAGTFFDGLGDGTAYMVRLTSTSNNIEGAFVNVGTQSQSGSSPSQANVFRASEAASTLLYSYVFNDDGFTAPVVINLGSQTANVTLYAYQGGHRVSETTFQVQAGKPWADVTINLFPELTGDFYMVAHADGGSLLGTSFLFNELLEPAMANAVPLDSVPEEPTTPTVSFAGQVQPIFNANCNGDGSCHLNGGDQRGLTLDAGDSYDNIVNKKSTVVTTETLIIPGNANDSYLYRKLNRVGGGISYAGSRMPNGGPFLSTEQINLIRDWILQGALNN